jgi:hypothetical protein
VYDAARVRERYGIANPQKKPEAVRDGFDRGHVLIETQALDKFHGVEYAAVGESANVVHGNDAGMFELREDAGFAKQAVGKIAAGAWDVQNFQSYAAVEFFIFRGEDHTHAAASDAFQKPVTSSGKIGHFRGVAETLENLVGKKFHLASQPKTAWASR